MSIFSLWMIRFAFRLVRHDPMWRSKRWLDLAIAVVLAVPAISLAAIARPWESWKKVSPARDGMTTLRIFSWNIWLKNWSRDDVERLFWEHQADIVLLYELNPELGEGLQDWVETFPAKDWNPEWDPGSIVAVSRIPETEFRRWEPAELGMAAIEVRVPLGDQGETVALLGMHTKSPTPFYPHRTIDRDKQLDAMAKWGREQSGPFALLGDFNTTPWSPSFRKLLRDSGTRDSRIGFGNLASWPAWLGAWGIPIDHCLVSSGWEVLSREVVYGDWGSDHAPILVTLGKKVPSSTGNETSVSNRRLKRPVAFLLNHGESQSVRMLDRNRDTWGVLEPARSTLRQGIGESSYGDK